MVSNKLFPKKNKKGNVDTVVKLKTTISQLNIKAKEYNRKSSEARLKAAKALKLGNKDLSRQFLIKWKGYKDKTERYYNMIGKIERHLDALEEAKTIENVTGAFEVSSKELNKISQNVNPEKAMQLSEGAEEAISKIEEAGEFLAGDPEVDLGVDVDDELAKLETELLMGDATGMPSIPEDGDLEEPAEPEDNAIRSKEDIKKEIDKLKKELDI